MYVNYRWPRACRKGPDSVVGASWCADGAERLITMNSQREEDAMKERGMAICRQKSPTVGSKQRQPLREKIGKAACHNSGIRKWWFMNWWFSNGSKRHTSKYVCENLAQTFLGLMCNECVWWHVRQETAAKREALRADARARRVGWHYLSSATCLTRPRSCCVFLVVSRITVICHLTRCL